MAAETMYLTAKVAWWVHPYIHAVAFFATITGAQPDPEKIVRTVLRGIRVEIS